MTICKYLECKNTASYNTKGLKARWCKTHKTPEMVDVKNNKCECGKIPKFNFPGETMGTHCVGCKTPEMLNVRSNKCACGKQPVFNLPGENVGICCKECKTEYMVNVVNKKCPCGKIPSFNLPGEIVGTHCVECKTPRMVDVINKKCACGKQPVFNFLGETVGICCKECKTEYMVDVVNNKCPCGKKPSFNLPGETVGTHCNECKTPEMVDVVSKKCPGYGGLECPVGYRLVLGCQYCLSCDPDDSRREKFKKYENAFFKYITGKIDVKRREFIVKYDPLETTKKWARLDGIVFGNGIIVCLEIDENGHKSYECDESRMHMVTAELLQQYPGVDVCWVRVNPTTEHKNPWGIAAKRVRAERFDAVVNAVNDILKNKTTNVKYIGFV